MTVFIDIGNSTIGFAFFEEGAIRRVVKIENELDSSLVCAKLANFLDAVRARGAIDKVVICSVVPVAQCKLQRMIKKAWGVKSLLIGKDLKIPIVNRYKSPRQVGKDRLLCAFAARELYGAPALVIDLGTAITFDGISSQGEYLGGVIIPGLRLSAEALFEKTALLPRVRMRPPSRDRVIGRSTEESILSGLFHGYGALCDGMIERLSSEIIGKKTGRRSSVAGGRPGLKVVMTGGYAESLACFLCHPVAAVDEELIFKGMQLLNS